MSRPTIWVHTLTVNEENFIYYSLMSVVEQVDKILVWDTGSTDRTVELINLVAKKYPDKVEFRQCGRVDRAGVTALRQQMLEQTKSDWILIVDADEVWWRESLAKVIKVIQKKGSKLAAIGVPYLVPVGDIFHLQDESAGEYQLLGRKGFLTIRGINRRIPGLHVENDYPLEGYVDSDQQLIQNRTDIEFVDAPYLHLTHLPRSSQQRQDDKYKLELGRKVSSDFQFPEAFQDPPEGVPLPWRRVGLIDWLVLFIITQLRQVKRRWF